MAKRANIHAAHGVQLDLFVHLKKDGTPRKPKGKPSIYTAEERAERRRISMCETKRKWRLAHPEENKRRVKAAHDKAKNTKLFRKKARLKVKIVRQKNPEREAINRRRQQTKARKANPEHYRAKNRAFYHANSEKYRAMNPIRKRARRIATPKWVDKKAIYKIYAEAIRLTKETGVVHHVDHIIPIKHKNLSGLNVPWNLRVITGYENMSKGNKFDERDALAPTAANGVSISPL